MPETVKINVEYLTRVEGHGNIVVDAQNGKLLQCLLEIVEAPRFFEGMLRGRSIFEAQHITSRICGICACAHTLVSVQAAEDALGITPTPQTIKLRELLLDMEILDSHILHIYLLAAPDLLGVGSFKSLIGTHHKTVRRALRMKKICNDVCDILVGRHVHPIACIAGGFTKLPAEKDLAAMQTLLKGLQSDMDATVDLALTLSFPEFERATEYVALVNDGPDYPLLSGDIGSSDGPRMDKHDYRRVTNEFTVPHSSAKFARFNRESYAVGALARLNLNFDKLKPAAKMTATALGFKPPVHNPYLNTVGQVIESVQCLDHATRIVEDFLEHGIDQAERVLVGLNEKGTLPVRAGNGVGAVEAPRGILFHNYETDAHGAIVKANCVIPTAQNVNNIEQDMAALVPVILHKSEAEITLALEMLVRAYDPCISCSAHFLKVYLQNQ
ncbi:MAG: Ni/Fe hydrogenase subunit alpha [Syntrophaceae bacterium]